MSSVSMEYTLCGSPKLYVQMAFISFDHLGQVPALSISALIQCLGGLFCLASPIDQDWPAAVVLLGVLGSTLPMWMEWCWLLSSHSIHRGSMARRAVGLGVSFTHQQWLPVGRWSGSQASEGPHPNHPPHQTGPFFLMRPLSRPSGVGSGEEGGHPWHGWQCLLQDFLGQGCR